MDSRGLLRGAGCGSIEVTVSGKAMVTTCFFWACAGRQAPAAAAATTPLPVVLRNARRLTPMIGLLPGASAPPVTALVPMAPYRAGLWRGPVYPMDARPRDTMAVDTWPLRRVGGTPPRHEIHITTQRCAGRRPVPPRSTLAVGRRTVWPSAATTVSGRAA